MTRTAFLPVLAATTLLAGCASSLSGLGGTDRYACRAPEGAQCTSVSGVYANTARGVLRPDKLAADKPSPATPAAYGASPRPAAVPTAAATSAPLRSAPRVLRLWIAPWEDADGDLHEDAFVHVVVDTGRWLIEHVRPALRSRMDRVLPPAETAQPAPEGTARSAPAPAPLPPMGFPLEAETQPMER
jgi:conjugal transfer pilus assembly protein TraV